jgi:hypothetical protein
MLRVAKSTLGVKKLTLGVARRSLGMTQSMLGSPKSLHGALRRMLVMPKNLACQAQADLLRMLAPRNPQPLKPQPERSSVPNDPTPTPMNQNQSNIRTMFQTTIDFLDANNSVWSATPAFADAVTRAKSGITAIDQSADTQQTPTSGVTEDKADARDDLEEKTLEVADQLSALATQTGDNDLGAKVEMTKSSLDKMTESDLEQTAERVASLATANMAALADFDVTAAEVTALTTARTTFGGIKTSPRQATVGRKTQTDSLPQLIANVRSIFRNEIDKMVTKKKKTNPHFFSGYFIARIIVNRAATQAAPPPPAPPAPPHP